MTPPERVLLSGNEAVALAARQSASRWVPDIPAPPPRKSSKFLRLRRTRPMGAQRKGRPGSRHRRGLRRRAHRHHEARRPERRGRALFTAAYTGVSGALVIVSADDPGMASSQNEQDNRRYAVAAGVPMLEPSDSQEAYDFTRRASASPALAIAGAAAHDHARLPFQDRSRPRRREPPPPRAAFRARHPGPRDDPRQRAAGPSPPAREAGGDRRVERKRRRRTAIDRRRPDAGIIASGIASMHAREAAPEAIRAQTRRDLPAAASRRSANSPRASSGASSSRKAIRSSSRPFAPRASPSKASRKCSASANSMSTACAASSPATPRPNRAAAAASRRQLCHGCPHRTVFETLAKLGCIVAGDIGCYSLGVLPPFQAMDTWSAWAPASAWDSACATCFPPMRPAAWSASSATAPSSTAESPASSEMVYNPPPPATWSSSSTTAPPP